jgi:hypothetical protein
MAWSTNIISDLGTVYTNGPLAGSTTLAVAAGGTTVPAAGPILDYVGNTESLILMAKEADVKLTRLLSVTDLNVDNANYVLLTNILSTLSGSSASGSASQAVVTNIGTVISNGPAASSATMASAIAPGGPILDYVGMCYSVQATLKEMYELNVRLMSVTDQSGDSANYAILLKVQNCLV